MNRLNPYAAPRVDSDALPSSIAPGEFLPEGRAVNAERGGSWLNGGFELFKKSPGTWIVILILYVLCMVLFSVLPIIGVVLNNLLAPVFLGGVAIGARSVDETGSLEVGHLFAGFQRFAAPLLLTGLVNLLGYAMAVGLAVLIGGNSVLLLARPGTSDQLSAALGLGPVFGVLCGLAVYLPVAMTQWFAPPLIALSGLPVGYALRGSLMATIKNLLPGLVFGLLTALMLFAAIIPLGLGLLVAIPTLLASNYAAYRDIFFAPTAPPA